MKNGSADIYVVSGVFTKDCSGSINVQNIVRLIKADTSYDAEKIFDNVVKDIVPDHEKLTIILLETKKCIKYAKLEYEQRKLAETCRNNHTLFSDKDAICEICGKPLNEDF